MNITFNGNVDRAMDFVKICESFQDDIDLMAGRYVIDAKSLLGVIAMSTMPNLKARIMTTNVNAILEFEDAIKDFAEE